MKSTNNPSINNLSSKENLASREQKVDQRYQELREIALRLSQLPESKKDLFRQALKKKGINPWKLPITPVNRDQHGERVLSFAQQRLWLLDQIEGTGGHTVINNALKLDGILDLKIVNQAFTQIIQRHESLRTCFNINIEGQAKQIIHPADNFSVHVHDLTFLDQTVQEQTVQKVIIESKSIPFDLANDLMLRANVIILSEQSHIIQFVTHHIASDGWSLAILIKEFGELYNAHANNRPSLLSELPIQYSDYAYWQRDWLQGVELENQLSYWRKQLQNLPTTHELPLDNPRPATQSFAGAKRYSRLSQQTSQRLRDYCHSAQATLFMGLHAAFSVLLSRYSGMDDIVVGSPVANREQQEVNSLIGFFVNLLVLRSDLSGDPDFDTMLERSKTCLLSAYEHQQVPFEEIVEDLKPTRSLNHSPLFQVLLVLQNNDNGRNVKLDGLTAQALEQNTDVSHYDLSLYVFERDDHLELSWQYNTSIFDQSTIEKMASHFNCLLESLLDKPKASINRASLLSESDKKEITNDWNNSFKSFEAKSVDELFSKKSVLHGDSIAAKFGEDSLTYAELETQSNQLAHVLQGQGIGVSEANQLVGIVQHRSLSMLVSVLAVMKAGAAYVPIDPNYPKDRVHYMLDHSGLSIVLTDERVLNSDLLSAVDDPKFEVINVDDPVVLKKCSTTVPNHHATEDDLAYVIYTSGSTGKPKGVQVTRANLVNFILGMEQQLKPSSNETLLAVTSLSFDIAALELYLPLICGAQVLIGDEQLSMDGERLKACIERGVTLMQATPVTWKLLLSAGWQPSLDEKANLDRDLSTSNFTALCGGEAFPLELAQELLKKPINVWNLYGPTETTVWSAAFNLNRNTDLINASVPIGKPIANTQLYVLDKQLSPVPVGVSGELYIGGAGVATGYLHSPELTDERFIDSEDFGRIYQTGDLARYRQGGILECLGRIDSQVKIRGYRIELGEVEHCLRQHPNVKDVAANPIVMTGEPVLVAYVVLDKQYDVHLQADLFSNIKDCVAEKIPSYMVPSTIVNLDALPLTPNGKVDRKALPTPDYSEQHVYEAPETELEKILVEIWQEILHPKNSNVQAKTEDQIGINKDRIGINDNFFSLGGHSMLVIRVIALLQARGINANVKQVFAKPILRDLAMTLKEMQNSKPVGSIFRAPERKIPDDCEQVKPEHLPLINLTQADIDLIAMSVPGGMSNILDIYPLGPLQQGIHFHHLMSQKSDPYVFPNLLKVADAERLETLLAGLQFMIDRHDVLRTLVVHDDISQTAQVVCRTAELPVQWQGFEKGQSVFSEMQRLCEADKQWMDINKAPLLSVRIAKEPSSEQHYVLLQYHHLISDHQGLEIIKKELGAFLNQKTDLLPTATPYREFIAHAQYQSENHDAKEFFSSMLSDIEEPTLPFGLTDTQSDGQQIVDYREAVPQPIAEKLRHVAKKEQVNPAGIFHAAWAMVVAACSNQKSVVFGSVLSGRLQGTMGAENMMGVFINTLPIRVDVDSRDVKTYVQAVNHRLTELLSFEQTPLVTAQNCSSIPPEQPLFSALLNYRHSNHATRSNKIEESADGSQNKDLTGIEFAHIEVRNNYPLTLSVDDYGEHGFNLAGLFHTSVDAPRLMGYMQNAISLIVEALANNGKTVNGKAFNDKAFNDKAIAIDQLSVLGESEHTALIRNDLVKNSLTSNRAPSGSSANTDENSENVIQLFENAVEKNALSPALIFAQQELSYGELNQQVNQLAYFLKSKKVGRDTPVALYMQRRPEIIVAMLATMKAGGCYLPLDTQWPNERVEQILLDAKPALILSQSEWQNTLDGLQKKAGLPQVYYVDSVIDESSECISNSELNSEFDIRIQDSAYIIYTSGSTGKPKGVVIEHRQLFNYLSGVNQRLEFSGMSFAHISTVAADLGNTGLFGALCYGGALHLIDSETAFDADKTAQTLASYPVDALKIVPGHLQGLMAAGNAKDVLPKKLLIIGGEACSIELIKMVKAINPSLKIVNHYGPSETTVGVLTHEITNEDIQSGQIPIGKPISNTQALILDTAGKLAPVGVSGELFIGGASVARGYLNRQALTQEFFVDSEYCSGRLYRTGDRVCMRDDGSIEFLGRIDNQVKVRGYRVELGDIESCLLEQSNVEQAVVLLLESDLNSRLVAFIQLENQHEDDALDEIKAWLGERLPEYMQPQNYDVVESISRTINGKVDRNALIEHFEGRDQDQSSQSVQPRNEIETILADVWCQVLQREQISIHDDFFAIGGDSILSLQVIARAKKKGIKLTPQILFERTTISQLAEQTKLVSNDTPYLTAPLLFGNVVLTPSQRFFLDANEEQKNDWQQRLVFNVAVPLEFQALQQASLALLHHHDALRMRFENFCDQWAQSFCSLDSYKLNELCQYSSAADLFLGALSDDAEINNAVDVKITNLQNSLDIEKGDVMRLAYISLSELNKQPDRLVLIVHKLVADKESLDLLINDLYELYQQALLQKPFDLGAKGVSFQQWGSDLKDYVQSPKFAKEVDYWQSSFERAKSDVFDKLLSTTELVDNDLEKNTVETQKTINFSLPPEQTQVLFKYAPNIYSARVNDLLLSMLVASFCEESSPIELEVQGHTRQLLTVGNGPNYNKSIGRFNYSFPVQLHLNSSEKKLSYQHMIDNVKTQLSTIPNDGIGYGLVRYLYDDIAIQEEFAKHRKPLVSFNYLGELDSSFGNVAPCLLSLVSGPSSSNHAKDLYGTEGLKKAKGLKRNNVLDIIGQIKNQQLQITMQYSSALHDQSVIEILMQRYQNMLNDLISHCSSSFSEQNFLEKHKANKLVSSLDKTERQKSPVASQQLQLIRSAEGNATLPIFCLHHGGGHTREYYDLAKKLNTAIPVYGIQSSVLVNAPYHEYDISVLAEHYANLIQSVQPQGPYRLLGWSLGGVLAIAITEVLEARGNKITFLALIDAILPNIDNGLRYQSDSLLDNLLTAFGTQAVERYAQIDVLAREKLERTLLQLDEDNALQFVSNWVVESGMVDETIFDQEYIKLYYRTAVQSRRLLQSYKPKKNSANVNLWWAKNSLNIDNDLPPTDWQQYCSGVDHEQVIEGGHYEIMQDDKLKQSVAAKLRVED